MKMLARAALLLSICLSPAAIAQKTSSFPAASALTGSELVPVIQGGANRNASPALIGNYTLGTTALKGYARPLPISRQRFLGTVTAGSGAYTFFQTVRAPAAYDAIQLVMVNVTNDATNAVKFSVLAPDSYGDGVNGTAAGATVTPTAVTWGTTSPRNPRNPGGGAATVFPAGGSGTAPNTIEGYAVSDIIPLASLARTDVAGAPPLLMIREYSAVAPYIQSTDAVVGGANPVTGAIPEFFCGFANSGDQTGTAGGIAVPAAGRQGYCPNVEVIYYLRGQRINTIASAGDSLDQGWCTGSTANCSAGRVNGWVRRLAGLTGAGYTAWSYAGQPSASFNERALNGLMLGDCAAGVTHLFFKPYSVNEGNSPPIAADLKRADHVLDWAYKCGITPILVYPHAGEGLGSAPVAQVVAYIDAAKARGVPTLDVRAVVSADGSITSNAILPAYQTLDSSGAVVDTIHLNDAGQAAVAAAAYAARAQFNL